MLPQTDAAVTLAKAEEKEEYSTPLSTPLVLPLAIPAGNENNRSGDSLTEKQIERMNDLNSMIPRSAHLLNRFK